MNQTRECDRAEPHANEFPRGVTEWDSRFDRRDFLKLTAVTAALAGLEGCSGRPAQNIVPYVKQPEQMVPGEPLFFTSAQVRGGYARGVIVTSREGRPIKIEGNPDHPASLGAADAQMQAEIFSLYDPQRSKTVLRAGVPETWGNFVDILDRRLSAGNDAGASLRILTGTIGSPTARWQLAKLLQKHPQARVHAYDPLAAHDTRNIRRTDGVKAPIYHFDRAEVIVSFDSDFLWNSPSALVNARGFIAGRRVRGGMTKMNRLYVVESTFSITGSVADHRLGVSPERVIALLMGISSVIATTQPAAAGGPLKQFARDIPTDLHLTPEEKAFAAALSADLLAAKGRVILLAGEAQPPAVHEAVDALNQIYGSYDGGDPTIELIDPPVPRGESAGPESLAVLTDDLDSGTVSTLLILAEDPAATAPGDIRFADALKRFSTARNDDGSARNISAHLAPYYNRTSYLCQWHINAAHWLESWSDAVAFDGTRSIVQPLIEPLYDGKTPAQFLAAALGNGGASSWQLVRDTAQKDHRGQPSDFEKDWTEALQTGVARAFSVAAEKQSPTAAPATTATSTAESSPDTGLTVRFAPDYSILDGSLAMNAWLQEIPRPLTKLVWSNAAILSPATAAKHNVDDNDLIELARGDKSIQIPVLKLVGHPDDVITLHLGYGQLPAVPEVSGDRGRGAEPTQFVGVDVNPLRIAATPWWTTGIALKKVGRKLNLVTTRNHNAMTTTDRAEDRKIVRHGTLSTFVDSPEAIVEKKKPLLSLYPNSWDAEHAKGPQWAMSIDQTACIGCNACVVACQAENNIPVVGPDQVAAEREMHWLRIDDYFTDDGVQHQPVPCMHCENAPCEYVCPVEATTHNPDGLNEMTYNRCVGTRYCSNNCPYKVRRFNFFNHTRPMADSLQLGQNPNVTVRSRGVMEKCTYCVQRLRYTVRKVEVATLDLLEQARAATDEAEKSRLNDAAKKLERDMTDKVQTACQQTCPTQAITFGDQTNPQSPVRNWQSQPHNYTLLADLTTKPRTSYLAKIANPNAALPKVGPT